MPKGSNQKLKLVYLIKIFLEKTDDEHSITMPEILEELARYDINAERKSIYTDIEEIRHLGIDIIGEQTQKTFRYHVASRDFEIAELKLLVDLIQSSRFITARKSGDLIKKLEGLASVYEAKQLQRQVFVSDRIKTMNESIYYNVDEIHAAISANKKISFKYFSWNHKKEMELKHDGKVYEISPWALSFADENYYLVGYDEEANMLKHYRVDKMLKLKLIDKPREGKKLFESENVAAYSQKHFGMFGGKEKTVILEFDNSMANAIIDRFGKDITIRPVNERTSSTHINVVVSDQFFGWIIGLSDKVKITGPDEVVITMKEKIAAIMKLYE